MSVSDQSSGFDICGIGMSLLDLLQVVEEFPSEEGITEAKECHFMGGGPVPTALCAASRLGSKVAVIDRIGDDWRGHFLAEEYRQFGVDTDHLLLESEKTTSLASVLIRQRDGGRHVVFSPGTFTPLRTEELPVETLEKTKILHLNGRHWPACLEAAKIVRKAGGLVSFDGGANRFDPKFSELIELAHIAVVARDFAEKFSGSDELADQLAALIGLGAEVAGITDGASGSWFATGEGEVFHQSAFPVSVVDTTGCGDAFHGGFLHAHARGWNVRESAMFASAVAAQNATAPGGRGNLPTLEEVLERIASRSESA